MTDALPAAFDAGAAAYDCLVGRWSRLFVPALLDAAAVAPGDVVLDLATGTGEAGAQAAARVGPRGRVVGVDLSLPMLAIAHRRPDARLAVAAMDGQALGCRPGVFDVVLCQLALMFFPDLPRALREVRRVLRPGGRFAAGVWSTAERAPLLGLLAAALCRQLPARRDELFVGFTLADPARLTAALSTAGFRDIRVRAERRPAVFASLEEFWAPIAAGGARMGQAYRGLPAPAQTAVRADVEAGLRAFESGGRIAMDLELLVAAAGA